MTSVVVVPAPGRRGRLNQLVLVAIGSCPASLVIEALRNRPAAAR